MSQFYSPISSYPSTSYSYLPPFHSSTSEYPYPLPPRHSHHYPYLYSADPRRRAQRPHHSRSFHDKTTIHLPLRLKRMDLGPEIYSPTTSSFSFDGARHHYQYQPERLRRVDKRFGPTTEHYSCINPPLRHPIPETVRRYRARPRSALPGVHRQGVEASLRRQERLNRGLGVPGRPSSPSDHPLYDSTSYVVSGALSPQQKLFYEDVGWIDPVAGTGINSPEIMVEHPKPRHDWFETVNPFPTIKREQPIPIPELSECPAQSHLDPDVHYPLSNETEGHTSCEQGPLSALYPPSSFFFPHCQPQPPVRTSSSYSSIEVTPPQSPPQSPPQRHVRFDPLPHRSYSPDPIRPHDTQALEDLLSLLQNALRKLNRRRILIRRHSHILQQQVERTRYERSKLRAEKRRWMEWLEKVREEEYYDSRRRDFDQRTDARNGWACNEEESHRVWRRTKHDYYDENEGKAHSSPYMDDEHSKNTFHDHLFSSPLFSAPPPPPNTPESYHSAILGPTSMPPQASFQPQFTEYDAAWYRTPITAPSRALPWPSSDLSASAVDRPTRDMELALEIQDDLSKQREWNVFCFFALAFGLSPQWVKDGGQNLRFELAGWHTKDVDLVGLKKQFRIEKVRWHPDKLGKRAMSGEDTERAKSVWVGVVRVGEEVEKLEDRGMFGWP